MRLCLQTLGVGIAGENLTYRLRVSVLANILRQHLGWFDSDAHSSAKLAARLATDVPVIKTVCFRGVATQRAVLLPRQK